MGGGGSLGFLLSKAWDPVLAHIEPSSMNHSSCREWRARDTKSPVSRRINKEKEYLPLT